MKATSCCQRDGRQKNLIKNVVSIALKVEIIYIFYVHLANLRRNSSFDLGGGVAAANVWRRSNNLFGVKSFHIVF